MKKTRAQMALSAILRKAFALIRLGEQTNQSPVTLVERVQMRRIPALSSRSVSHSA
jgi:hypothetical protein